MNDASGKTANLVAGKGTDPQETPERSRTSSAPASPKTLPDSGLLRSPKSPMAIWVLVCAMLMALLAFRPAWQHRLEGLELQTLDWRLTSAAPSMVTSALSPWITSWQPSPDITVVAFDDATLNGLEDRYGAWPWPRSVHARLIQTLTQLGARAIVIDLLYLGEKSPEDDAALRDVIQKTPNVVLSGHLTQDGTLQMAFPGLMQAARGRVGMINHQRDVDGISRRMPLWFKANTPQGVQRVPSLTIAAFQALNPSKKLFLASSDRDNTLLVRWPRTPNSGTYPTLSAKAILEAMDHPELPMTANLQRALKGKIVLVGATAVGLFDIKTTPISPSLPGVYFQAAALDTLRQTQSGKIPPLRPMPQSLEPLWILAPAVIAMAALWFSTSVTVGLIWPILLGAAILGISWLSFYAGGWITPVASPLILLGGLTVLTLAAKLIARSQDADRTYALATLDGLTGLYNRRYFDEQLSRAIDQARRTERTFSLIMLDVDHFKRINDNFGHPAGDRVLKLIAETLSPLLRSGDVLARFGGEEFVVILMESSQTQAIDVANKLVEAVAQTPMTLPSGLPLTATISAGVACFNTPEQTADTLIARADLALYQAKATGRNRVAAV